MPTVTFAPTQAWFDEEEEEVVIQASTSSLTPPGQGEDQWSALNSLLTGTTKRFIAPPYTPKHEYVLDKSGRPVSIKNTEPNHPIEFEDGKMYIYVGGPSMSEYEKTWVGSVWKFSGGKGMYLVCQGGASIDLSHYTENPCNLLTGYREQEFK